MNKFESGDRIIVSEECSFARGMKGKITDKEPNMEPFDYVVRLDEQNGMTYEFEEDETQRIEGCDNQHHTLVYSTKRKEWICPWCEK